MWSLIGCTAFEGMTTDKLSYHITVSSLPLLPLGKMLYSVFVSLCLTEYVRDNDIDMVKGRIAVKEKRSERHDKEVDNWKEWR